MTPARASGRHATALRCGPWLFAEVQRIVAEEVPYISLWHIRNVIVAQRTLTGLRLSPIADFSFLRDVARIRPAAN